MAKRAFSAKYEASDILTMYEQQRDAQDEVRLRSTAETMRALVRMEHNVSIPEQYRAITKTIKTPFIRDAHARIAASLVSKPPVVVVEPRDEQKEEYREAAATASRWDMEFIERQAKDGDEDAMYKCTSDLVRDGESVLKVVHVPNAWANFPRFKGKGEAPADVLRDQDAFKKTADLPIAWRAVDRLSCVFLEGEYGTEGVIEYGEYPLPYAKKWGFVDGPNGRPISPEYLLGGRPKPENALVGGAGTCVKLEYVDSEEWHVVVDGMEAPGFPRRNPYAPHLNYFRAKANDSESLLFSLLFLVPGLDALLTMKGNWAYLGAYPNPVEESVPQQGLIPGLDGPDGELPTGRKEVLWKPGKYLSLPPGKRLSFLIPPPVGGDINELIQLYRGMIDVAGIPSVMRGSGGAESGYQENQMLAAASLMYRLASQSLERQFSEALDFIHWMVPNVIRQTVWVKGYDSLGEDGRPNTRADRAYLALSPESSSTKGIADVGKLGPVTVMYRPVLPTDMQARAMVALQLTQADKPLMSTYTAMKDWVGIDDPDKEQDRIFVEKAMSSPQLEDLAIQKALEEAGMAPPEQAAPTAPAVDPNAIAALAGGVSGAIPPGPNQLTPQIPGQAAGGIPSVPGLNMPIVPTPPQGGGSIIGNPGGRPEGVFPGMPGTPMSGV